MGSKGRNPPPHMRISHSDPYGLGIPSRPGPFPHFDKFPPPPEIVEQKLAAQHAEMQRLGTENQRIAATHGTLRHELAAAQHELQILHAQIGAVTSEREQQTRNLTDKIAKMEAELKAAEPVKVELQKAHSEAQNLVVSREELFSKVHQLNQELQRAHVDMQQMPPLMAELDSLRQEYQHCRATFDYEKKFYSDHLESLQVMEKNYMTMSREVEKLRAELLNASNVEKRTVGQYGGTTGNNENDAYGHSVAPNAYEDGYGIHQMHSAVPPSATGANANPGASSVYVGTQSGSGPAPMRSSYEMSRGPAYDLSRMTGYESQRAPIYDAQRGSSYDSRRSQVYDAQRGAGYDTQRGSMNDTSRGQAGNLVAQHGQQAAPLNNGPYVSAIPPGQAGNTYEPPTRGANPVKR